jgi:pyruvate,water dikinase
MVTLDNEKGSDRAEKPVPEDRAKTPTLNEEKLARLGAAGKKIEAHFGYDADVEWAFEGDTLYILQARKIRGLEE